MNRKGPWEGYRRQAKPRPLSPSRLPLRAHRERRLGTRQEKNNIRILKELFLVCGRRSVVFTDVSLLKVLSYLLLGNVIPEINTELKKIVGQTV